jgi:hypothetical protein
MATIRADLISPTETPFEVSEFWEDDEVSVSAFTTGIDKRDGEECIIDGCGYDIADCLDHCHIVGRNDRKTVHPPSTTFSVCLSDFVFFSGLCFKNSNLFLKLSREHR